MKAQNITAVSIHADPTDAPGFDLKDILAALELHRHQWVWCVRRLDWLGDDADALCRLVEAAPNGVWLTSLELTDQAQKIYETIEGEFLAFPGDTVRTAVDPSEPNLDAFPESRAELAIVAVDGCYFEVFAKNAADLAFLRGLKNLHLREENIDRYFPATCADNSAAARYTVRG